MTTPERPIVLSIAGHDPSGGAGLNADLKTFEALKVYGLSVCTALTIQNDTQFEAVHWSSKDVILSQVEILARKFKVQTIKVGLVRDLDILLDILVFVKQKWPQGQLIWDPIIKASAGFSFHEDKTPARFLEILKLCDLVTPNEEEFQKWFSNLEKIPCAMLRKGGHREGEKVEDLLSIGEETFRIAGKRLPFQKHGSGCVLSAAITANLARGLSIREACGKARAYTLKFLTSNHSLLGYHIYD